MKTRFEFESFSIRNPQKQKCGDASFSSLLTLSGEECPVLIIADGVSRAPKDWLASKSTITFLEEFLSGNSLPIPELLKEAVNFANQKVIEGVEDTFGMLTTLVALVYQPSEQKAYWANVGDSRLYSLTPSGWEQISIDDLRPNLTWKTAKFV